MHIGRMKILGRVTFVEEFGGGDGISASSQWGRGFICIFSPVDGHHPSVTSPESEMSIFEYLYIEETVTQNVELLSIFGSLAIFHGSLSGLKSQINRQPFTLIACTDTILGGDTSLRLH